jgi:hypothetical protein
MRSLIYLLLAFLLLFEQGFSAPIPSPPPVVHKPGDFVGVRPAAYEEKSKENKKISIHPGVVIAGPSKDGTYQVAMISKSLPDNPPQASIQSFHPESNIYGSVSLARPKDVHLNMMKPWKDGKTGNVATPMNPPSLENMKNMMKPHVNWKPTASAPQSPKEK